MGETAPGGAVLVAVEDPTHVQQLVRTAGDLARQGAGMVRLVTVVVKPHDSPFGVFADETIVREFGGDSERLLKRARAPPGVTIERDVVVSRTVARGILAAVEETDPAALVVGWEGGPRRADAVLGSTVDRLVEYAECDLYVERVGREADGVDSVLLPVAGGPHVGVAATVGKAIAVRNDASVLVFSVATDGTGAAEQYAAEGRGGVIAAPGPDVPVETAVREADDVTAVVVAESAAHDVVVFGATRQGPLRRHLVGSVPRRVVDRTDTTVVVARDGDVVGGLLHHVGGLLRR